MLTEVFITVSDVMEYLSCPRFIYYMYCPGIPQHEEKRYKVLKGRALHEAREKVNRSYVRNKLQCVQKEVAVYLVAKRHYVKGEVLFLEDGTAAPLDYKFAEFKGRDGTEEKWRGKKARYFELCRALERSERGRRAAIGRGGKKASSFCQGTEPMRGSLLDTQILISFLKGKQNVVTT